MAGEWGTTPWGGEAPTEAAGSGTGYWGGDVLLPKVQNVIPTCGTDTIAVNQTITFDVLDVRADALTPGIDLSQTTITILVSGSPVENVYISGAFASGWITSSTVTPITGPPPGQAFSLVRDAGYPNGATVVLTIVAVNNDGGTSYHTCRYVVVPSTGIYSTSMLGQSRIRVTFNTAIKASHLSVLTAPENWTIRPIPGNAIHSADNLSFVKAVHTERRYNPRYVILDVQPLVSNQRYEIWSTGFEDIFARSFDGSSRVSGESRRTKVDAVLEGLPPMWEGKRVSNVFWVLAAIAEQDETIGGSQGIVLADPLDRNF